MGGRSKSTNAQDDEREESERGHEGRKVSSGMHRCILYVVATTPADAGPLRSRTGEVQRPRLFAGHGWPDPSRVAGCSIQRATRRSGYQHMIARVTLGGAAEGVNGDKATTVPVVTLRPPVEKPLIPDIPENVALALVSTPPPARGRRARIER